MKFNFMQKSLLIATAFVTTAAFLILRPDHKDLTTEGGTTAFTRPETEVLHGVSKENEFPQDWVSQVKSELVSRSADFQMISGSEYTAFNNTNQLRTYTTPSGMRLKANPSGKAEWQASLKLNSVQTDKGAIASGDLKAVSAEKNKLTYDFENLAVEYINSEEGIRQNFIVKNSPDNSGSLTVNLGIETNLNKNLAGNSLVLSHNGLQLMRYSDLKVWDKNGKPLTANMEMQGDLLALNVDVENATFPVTIDPISTTYAWKITGGQPGANLGFWVSGRGDLNGDGYSDVVVGSTYYTHVLHSEGAVFVYYGSASGLHTTPDWAVYGEQDSCLFGRSVSTEGDLNNDGYDDLVIGAAQITNPMKNEGKVYMYLGGPSGLATTPAWTFEGGRKNAKLGDVAIIGDTNGDGFDDVVVGAHGWDNTEDLDTAGNKAGKFWVFMGDETGLEDEPWMSCTGQDEDANLGVSLDAAGDINGDGYADFHVGGYIFLVGDGMICSFNGGPEGPDNIPDFMAIGGAHDTSFYAVNLSRAGDINGDGFADVLIGMPRFDADGVYQAGKLRYHLGSSTGFDTTKYDLFGEGQNDERFAFNVNDAGDLNKDGYDDILLTSKHYNPTGTFGDSLGRGYLYLGGPNGPSPKPNWTFDGESVSGVGTNIASAGDINGDGLTDVLLSSDSYSEGTDLNEGVCYLFYGIEQVCEKPTSFNTLGVGTTSATFTWDWIYGSYMYKVYIKKVGSAAAPIVVTTHTNSITVTGLTPGAIYKCYVKCKCQAGWTGRSAIKTIHTPLVPREEAPATLADITIYPNPVSDVLNVNTGSATNISTISIYDVNGNLMISKTYTDVNANQVLQIDETSRLAGGVYFIQITNGSEYTVKKFTKAK